MNLPGLFEKCSCGSGAICAYCVQLALAALAVVAGAFVAFRSRKRLVGLAVAVLGALSFLFVWLIG